MTLAYSTRTGLGACYYSAAKEFLSSEAGQALRGTVNLIFTSPPFALNRQKPYRNELGDKYKAWLSGFAPLFKDLLAPQGSIVLELGNAWEPGKPVMSTLPLEGLLPLLQAEARLAYSFDQV